MKATGIATLKAYAQYKASGMPWLEHLPAHWEQRRTKFLFRERVQKGFPDEPLLAATQSKGVLRKEDYGARTVTASKDLHLLKLVEKGDFVISLRSFEGGIEVAHCRGIISPAYTILTPRPQVLQGYYSRLLKSRVFVDGLTLFISGIREGQNIDYERLGRAYLPLPPAAEQHLIGRFLDWANGKLDRAIWAKRKVIALVNEQRQAIIHRAITQGLDASVPLRPSGVPWLPDIPEHWEVMRLGSAIQLQTGFPFASTGFITAGIGTRLLRGINVTPSGIRWDAVVRWQRRSGDGLDKFVLEVGDIVLGMDRPIVGPGVRVATILKSDAPSLLLQRVARMRPTNCIEPRFLVLLIRGRSFTDYVTPIFTGISVPHLSPQQIKGFKVPLPPLEEQQSIVAYIEAKTSNLDGAVSRLEREIDLLREFRTRLVADVVTGKLDVREAAGWLPNEVPDTDQAYGDLSDVAESADDEAAA